MGHVSHKARGLEWRRDVRDSSHANLRGHGIPDSRVQSLQADNNKKKISCAMSLLTERYGYEQRYPHDLPPVPMCFPSPDSSTSPGRIFAIVMEDFCCLLPRHTQEITSRDGTRSVPDGCSPGFANPDILLVPFFKSAEMRSGDIVQQNMRSVADTQKRDVGTEAVVQRTAGSSHRYHTCFDVFSTRLETFVRCLEKPCRDAHSDSKGGRMTFGYE